MMAHCWRPASSKLPSSGGQVTTVGPQAPLLYTTGLGSAQSSTASEQPWVRGPATVHAAASMASVGEVKLGVKATTWLGGMGVGRVTRPVVSYAPVPLPRDWFQYRQATFVGWPASSRRRPALAEGTAGRVKPTGVARLLTTTLVETALFERVVPPLAKRRRPAAGVTVESDSEVAPVIVPLTTDVETAEFDRVEPPLASRRRPVWNGAVLPDVWVLKLVDTKLVTTASVETALLLSVEDPFAKSRRRAAAPLPRVAGSGLKKDWDPGTRGTTNEVELGAFSETAAWMSGEEVTTDTGAPGASEASELTMRLLPCPATSESITLLTATSAEPFPVEAKLATDDSEFTMLLLAVLDTLIWPLATVASTFSTLDCTAESDSDTPLEVTASITAAALSVLAADSVVEELVTAAIALRREAPAALERFAELVVTPASAARALD